jgi:hypothetical protein
MASGVTFAAAAASVPRRWRPPSKSSARCWPRCLKGSPIYFIGDGHDNKFRTEIMLHLEKVGASDLTQDDLLWTIIGEH